MPDRFGFAVEHCTDEDGQPADLWEVKLPHQCDSWVVAGEGWGMGAPHAEAVAALEAFIAEAQAALVELRARREVAGL